MPILTQITLLKTKISEDIGTLNNAHAINMDSLKGYLTDVVLLLNEVEASVLALTPTVAEVKKYRYPLNMSLPDATPEEQSDGTTITKNGLVFSVVHITSLLGAVIQVSDINGKISNEDLDIKIDQVNSINLEITLPIAFPDNLSLVIIN